jgi:hypothetical protein
VKNSKFNECFTRYYEHQIVHLQQQQQQQQQGNATKHLLHEYFHNGLHFSEVLMLIPARPPMHIHAHAHTHKILKLLLFFTE